ncbi:MAG: ATP-binding cassette domain-containing protein [Desulfovibrionaceae bacterium]|nr:ATP-binding cassette domain-containing protein [Desulfovibrionaceae bacterium]
MKELPLLEIQGLRKAYTNQTPIFCAEIQSLTLYPGQILGITGPSGCGKSTLLELLALLTKADCAERYILRTKHTVYDVKALWDANSGELSELRRSALGFVHQAGGLFPFLSCRENIALPLLLNHRSLAEQKPLIHDLILFLGLEHVADKVPEQLSYGERQRTAIARALIHSPNLILADEPTSALDPDSARAAMHLLCEGCAKTGAALLVVSHDHALLDACGIPIAAMQLATDSDGERRHYILDAGTETSQSSQSESLDEAEGRSSFWWLPFYLAWRDFCHEYALSLCAILAFAAALCPIIVLGGLRNGVITTLTQRFLNNPSSLSVQPYSALKYSEEDIQRLGEHPAVAFIVPQTRSLASTVLIPREGKPATAADVIPTAQGDPLLLRYARVPGQGEAVITNELARSLTEPANGKEIDLIVSRRVDGRDERVFCRVRIVGILPDAADWKAHVYLPLDLLIDMERYRDGFSVPKREWKGEAYPEDAVTSYAGFRMYVKNPEAVLTVRDALKEQGIDAWTHAREVETIQGLQRALSLITLLVGGVTLAGMSVSLASLAVGNVRRKARLTAQGRLMGLGWGQLVSVPLIQMALTSLFAASCSLIFSVLVAHILQWAASPWLEAGERACQLESMHLALLYVGSLCISCVCGFAASFSLFSLQPAEVLRRDS